MRIGQGSVLINEPHSVCHTAEAPVPSDCSMQRSYGKPDSLSSLTHRMRVFSESANSPFRYSRTNASPHRPTFHALFSSKEFVYKSGNFVCDARVR